jgi:flagellar export protein FliJ
LSVRGFKFRYEPILKFRKGRQDLCRQLLAQLLAEDSKLARQRELLEHTRVDQLNQLRNLGQPGKLDVDKSASRRYFAGRLVGDLQLLEQNRNLLAQQLQLCRQTLAKADQDVKTLEKLRENQLAAFRYQTERRAMHELDEAWQTIKIGERS